MSYLIITVSEGWLCLIDSVLSEHMRNAQLPSSPLNVVPSRAPRKSGFQQLFGAND